MSKSTPQSFENHGRIDPPFHFVLLFVVVANLIFAIVHLWQHRNIDAVWFLVLSLVLFIPFFKLRTYPLRVQDRIIRLEERLRLQALAPADFRPQIDLLTEDQLIALRFAPDDEVVQLAREALEGNLSRTHIKKRIKNWRPDNFRI
jgi:hypothetical protein